jgi:hypothetical protein
MPWTAWCDDFDVDDAGTQQQLLATRGTLFEVTEPMMYLAALDATGRTGSVPPPFGIDHSGRPTALENLQLVSEILAALAPRNRV